MTIWTQSDQGAVYARPRRRSLRALFSSMFETRRQRSRLSELDPHMLRDIGLSEDDVRREVSRPLWDVPKYWQK